MQLPTVLILDDDLAFARAAAEMARSAGFVVHPAGSVAQARAICAAQRMDLLLLDLGLPDGSGMDLLQHIDLAEHGQVVVVTARPSLDTACRAVATPVAQYLIKPLADAQLRALFETCRATRWPRVEPGDALAVAGLTGRSAALRKVVDTLLRVAPTDATVLLAGESGTGKELAARALHDLGGRSGAFVALNCGAVPAELLASQLFGHERGSFTGAHARHQGVFEQAANGTLLLDEITEMPMHLQVYLLRVLESGSVTRVGGTEAVATPVRVVASTNRDPQAAIASGQLREDVYYRLADIQLVLPPLRERADDVVLLARLFIERLNLRYGRQKYLAPGAESALLVHDWPGNVRELRSAVQRAYLLDTSDALQLHPGPVGASVLRETETSIVFSVGTTMAEIERRMLLKTLAHLDNDKTATARVLGVSVRTIHNQLARINVPPAANADDIAA